MEDEIVGIDGSSGSAEGSKDRLDREHQEILGLRRNIENRSGKEYAEAVEKFFLRTDAVLKQKIVEELGRLFADREDSLQESYSWLIEVSEEGASGEELAYGIGDRPGFLDLLVDTYAEKTGQEYWGVRGNLKNWLLSQMMVREDGLKGVLGSRMPKGNSDVGRDSDRFMDEKVPGGKKLDYGFCTHSTSDEHMLEIVGGGKLGDSEKKVTVRFEAGRVWNVKDGELVDSGRAKNVLVIPTFVLQRLARYYGWFDTGNDYEREISFEQGVEIPLELFCALKHRDFFINEPRLSTSRRDFPGLGESYLYRMATKLNHRSEHPGGFMSMGEALEAIYKDGYLFEDEGVEK